VDAVKRLVVAAALMTLVSAGQERLVIEPAGYIDEAIARSAGIAFDELEHGLWAFDDIELELLLPHDRVLRLPHARVNGQTFGEQIVTVEVVLRSQDPGPGAALELMRQLEVLARLVGWAPVTPIPTSSDELNQLEREGVLLIWPLKSDSEGSISVGLQCAWLKTSQDAYAAAWLQFNSNDLVPRRPP